MTATTISPELTAHLTKRALELEQLADSIESGVIDPMMLGPALQLVTIAARRLLESCPGHMHAHGPNHPHAWPDCPSRESET